MGEFSGGFAGHGDTGRARVGVGLPPRRLSFVGRTADLGEIAARLARYPVVTLTGVGGVGKTALAVEAGWIEVSAGRADLACYVDLVPCRGDEQVVAALVEAVGIRGAEAAAGLEAVAGAVSGCRWLLVIDNCEHVLEPARRACGLLAGRAADLRVLATSRIPLDIEPECVWRVQPMAVPGEAGPTVATEAVALFLARAAMAGVTVRAGPGELVLAGSICRQAGGLPLALELVANRLRVSSLTELAAGLGPSGWPARTTGSGRHDSLEACLGWSHALLPADAAVVFRRLSVFPGGFDLAAAREVAGAPPVGIGEVDVLVEQLVTASLLEADTSGTRTRFRFHEPVRQYAAERLADAGEEDLARWRHARVFLARAEVIEPLLFAPRAEQQCDLLEFDRPDHDAALGWFLSCGAAAEAQRLAAALYFFWYTRGWFVTGLRWLRAALAAEAQVEPLVRLRAEVGLAQLAFIAGDYLASFAAIESALPAARLLGDDVVLARCLATAGYVWWFLDPGRSAALFEEALEAADRGGDGWTRSTGLAGLGWARYYAGRFEAAAGPLREGIELTARSGRRQQFAMAVLGRAAVELWLGQLAAAQASAQQALGVLVAAGDATWTSAALAILAEIERAGGRLDPAGQHAAEAIEVAGRANSAVNVMLATGHLGRILLARGEPGAAGHLEQAVQLARGFAVWPLLAWWLDSLGELAELEGRHGDARSWYEQAAGHAAGCGLAADASRARHHLGRLAWMTGDLASAVNSCHEALARQLEVGDTLGLVETLETLGGLLIDEGRARRGLPLLAAASAARERLGFPARPVEAGRIAGWVASGREYLGEQAQPAWERGAGLSVQEAAAMARRGRGPRRRPAFGWSSLTPAERNVADLVARGLTNPEIAARLGVSAGTVKGHVSSVLRKLDVRTRAELAAAVSGHSGI
ncbi:MAG TPA: LuxR C-terminal-related transcriptional regulator [Streptosporangiaceae bacterium]